MINNTIATYTGEAVLPPRQRTSSLSNSSSFNVRQIQPTSPTSTGLGPVIDACTEVSPAAATAAAEPGFAFPPRTRSASLRRQSISLNAVLNHRRALLGALISGMGSNVSLPSCVLGPDQELVDVTTAPESPPPPASLPPPPPPSQPPAAVVIGSRHVEPENTTTSGSSHKSMLLQLTPANACTTAAVAAAGAPLNAGVGMLDVQKEKLGAAAAGDLLGESVTKQRRVEHAELMSSLSTLYANLLVVVGVAVPVTASVSQQVPAALDQGFYLFLYLGSVAFVVMMYGTLLREKAIKKMIVKHVRQENTYTFIENGGINQTVYQPSPSPTCKCAKQQQQQVKRVAGVVRQQHGSFCLRLGTVGFGAGSIVFTGLQIGAELASGETLQALVPGARLLLVTVQMHFIFLNSKDLVLTRHKALAKLGLMHLIATNICEWLQALVEETRYEIFQLEKDAREGGESEIHRKLLRDASPFLFPCTIEFSLICAVILFEMWKSVDRCARARPGCRDGELGAATRSVHQLSIDCASAHRGLFGGVLIISATVLSLIMFFVLKEAKPIMAIQQVTSLEVAIHLSGTVAAIGGMMKMRALDYKDAKPPHLDSTLLGAAQAGVYLHTLFGAVGSILTQGPTWIICLAADFLALFQSTAQTILIKIAWRRRSRSNETKPGKELITYLIVSNLAMWTMNTLEKSRASVRPDHLEFFGVWAWTIITHVSMPLAIFYRFHSAICLFEVWKSCYKYKPTALVAAMPAVYHE